MRCFVITCWNIFNVWPKTTLLLPGWPRDAKRLDTPVTVMCLHNKLSVFLLMQVMETYNWRRPVN